MSRQPAQRPPSARPLIVSSQELRDRVKVLLYSPVHFQGGAASRWGRTSSCRSFEKAFCTAVSDEVRKTTEFPTRYRLAKQLIRWLSDTAPLPKVQGLAEALATVLDVRTIDLQVQTVPPGYVEKLSQRQKGEWAYVRNLGEGKPS